MIELKENDKKKHLTLEGRIQMFEKLPNEEKGSVEMYDWGEDLGKEIMDVDSIYNGGLLE